MEQFLTRFAAGIRATALAGVAALLIGCDHLAAFEPVMIDDDQVFAMQARDVATSTTGTATYEWTNPEPQAIVDHATTTHGAGSASIRITDAAGTLVYSSALLSHHRQSTANGVPGTWRIVVTMTGYTGTLGFYVLPGAP